MHKKLTIVLLVVKRIFDIHQFGELVSFAPPWRLPEKEVSVFGGVESTGFQVF